MACNLALLNPRNRENIASVLRSGQNLGLSTLMIIGGVIRDKYKGNIHKFSHQMDTQDGMSQVTVMYFESLSDFLKHLPGRTTLTIVETVAEAESLPGFCHPENATYLFGPEIAGISPAELRQIRQHFLDLNQAIPTAYQAHNDKTAHLKYIQIQTPASLNLGVCAAIVLYDRFAKAAAT